MNPTIDNYRDWDAAYVLGALSPDERREFERHLVDCEACKGAVAELAGMPGLLGKIDSTTAQSLASPAIGAQVVPMVSIQNLALAAMKNRSQTIRKIFAGAAIAASVVMIIGLALGANLISNTSDSGKKVSNVALGTKIAMTPIGYKAMVVDMHVVKKAWGTQFSWNCVYAGNSSSWSTPRSYDLVITDDRGVSTVVATWSQSGARAKGLVASTGIPLSQIKTIDVRYTNSTSALVRGQV